MGLSVQEAQCVFTMLQVALLYGNDGCRLDLAADVRKFRRHASAEVQLKLEQRRQRLLTRVEQFHTQSELYLDIISDDWQLHRKADGSGAEGDNFSEAEWDDFSEDGQHVSHAELDEPFKSQKYSHSVNSAHPERIPLLLPSTFGSTASNSRAFVRLVKQETILREGQAHNSLHQLRIALGHKAYLFRSNVRLAKSQKQKTRAWVNIHSIDKSVQKHARIYSRARKALVHLGATKAVLSRYQTLRKDHLKATTALMEQNIPGQRNKKLAWFWNMDVKGDMSEDGWMEECLSFQMLLLSCIAADISNSLSGSLVTGQCQS
jgi:hypothetical protein